VKLPRELADAIQLFETLRYTEVGRPVAFNIEDVTPKNAEDKIREFAEELAVSEAPGGGLSVLERAKNVAVEAAARRVRGLASAAVPNVIEQATPAFNKHVETYTEAVAKLPETVTAETLLSAGPEAVEAYQIAKREAHYLNMVSSWVAGTGVISGVLAKHMEVVLRILRPESSLELTKLDAARAMPADPALIALEPVFYAAARLGVEFRIHSLRQAKDLRKSLELRPQALQQVATMA
jgi:hypothetical protein